MNEILYSCPCSKTEMFTNTDIQWDKPASKLMSEGNQKTAMMTKDWERKPHRCLLRCMTEHTHVHTCRISRHIHQLCYCVFPTNWKWNCQPVALNLREMCSISRETLLRATEDSNRRTCHLQSLHTDNGFPNVNLQMPWNTYQNHSQLFPWTHKLLPTFTRTSKGFRVTMAILRTITSK